MGTESYKDFPKFRGLSHDSHRKMPLKKWAGRMRRFVRSCSVKNLNDLFLGNSLGGIALFTRQ